MADKKNLAQQRLTADMHLVLVTPPPPKPEVKATGPATAKLLRLQ